MSGPQDPIDAVEHLSVVSEPWWLRPLYVFGVPAGIAVFLVWFLTSVVSAGQNKMQETLDAHARDQAQQLILLELICRNTAPTDRAAAQCDVARR